MPEAALPSLPGFADAPTPAAAPTSAAAAPPSFTPPAERPAPVERPAQGRLWLELRDEGGGPVRATATLSRDGQSVELSPQPGGLLTRGPAGPWTLRVDANGYLSREQTVVLPSGGEQRLSLTLLRRPAAPRHAAFRATR